jgi:hypothetical protein
VTESDDDDYRFGPEYGGLSNHLPMTTRALRQLGADSPRVDAFRATYSQRLTALAGERTASSPATELDVKRLLGQRHDFLGVLEFFVSEVEARGTAEAVRRWLPVLMPGVAAAAFHPLIMLYYALDAGSARGVAYALAYFAWSYLPLATAAASSPGAELGLDAAIARLAPLRREQSAAGLLFTRLQSEAQRPEIRAILDAVASNRADFASTARLVIAAHQQVDDLLSLHMVTAFHAYERIRELLSSDTPTDRVHLVRALLTAYLTCGAPELRLPPDTSRDWSMLRERAIGSPDEHVIKLVFTCHDMAERWQLPTRALAARAVQLV